MPDTFPTENASTRLDFSPLRIEGVTMWTDPCGAELPRAAVTTALHQKPTLAQPGPVRGRQAIGLSCRDRQACRKIGRNHYVTHSVASEPRRRLLTGETIGPPMTIATSFLCTWLVDTPRT